MFYGISIRMFFRDHPPPHFHAFYGEYIAKIELHSLRVIERKLPGRALALVLEWAAQHREELEDNWRRREAGEPLQQIHPLD